MRGKFCSHPFFKLLAVAGTRRLVGAQSVYFISAGPSRWDRRSPPLLHPPGWSFTESKLVDPTLCFTPHRWKTFSCLIVNPPRRNNLDQAGPCAYHFLRKAAIGVQGFFSRCPIRRPQQFSRWARGCQKTLQTPVLRTPHAFLTTGLFPGFSGGPHYST